MQNQSQTPFLEDWLRPAAAAASTVPHSPAPPPVRDILQAWVGLRDPSITAHPDRLLAALQTLTAASSSLHVAEPQAKLLLSLLSSSPPPSSHPFLFHLLYIYLRKSPRPSPQLLESAVPLLSSLSSSSTPHGLLLLGALAAAPPLSEDSRRASLDLFCRLLEEERSTLGTREEFVPEVVAGIGYALSLAQSIYFARILGLLLGIWASGCGFRPTLLHGLMVLRLVEWLVSGFINSRSFERIQLLCGEISTEKCETRGNARFAALMASAGVLRAFRMVRRELDPRSRISIEASFGAVAKFIVSSVASDHNIEGSSEKHLLLQCIALGLGRCGPISFNAHVLHCLCLALLSEVVPLLSFFRKVLESPNGNSVILALNEVRGHSECILFKEAGAVTGVFCNLYGSADDGSKALVESYIWGYCQELYSNLRIAVLVHRGKNDELLGDLGKIAEAAFLMVVVFAAEVTKHKLNPKSSQGIHPEVSVRILVSFSCIEYLRRVRLPEYTDAVRRAVLTLQENLTSCALFIESMPSYVDLTNQPGSNNLEGKRYDWSSDEVQTARMLFYLRVIPTSISLIHGSVFGKLVAPAMFLYMQHPNGKVAQASHSLFVAFVTSGKDTDQDDRSALKEQLVFYYMQRALEVYPLITPFEVLASGVVAVVRHLPAGSPAIFYCVHSLVGKARNLCKTTTREDISLWKTREGWLEPCEKVIELLLRLTSLIDVQVLPYLLKQLAEFVVELPKDGQDWVLDQMYSQVAESDDVTRKPVLVSWLQSLSYLCSQSTPSNEAGCTTESLNFNRTHARL